MKATNHGVLWGAVLLLAGLFLLLRNLGVFGPWGDAIWGGLFVVAGLAFLIWFVLDTQEWWRTIPGFTLLSIGAVGLLDWQGIDLGDWVGSIVMFGVALGFWTTLLVRSENWWAVLPAGVLTVLGLLVGFQAQIGGDAWLAAFFIGLGLVFALLYLIRRSQRAAWWAAVPAAGLLLLGLVTLASLPGQSAVVVRWWPVLLLLIGAIMVVFFWQRPPRPTPAAPAPGYDIIPPAKGTSVTDRIPDADLPPRRAPQEPAPIEKPVDIYEILAQQPDRPDEGRGNRE